MQRATGLDPRYMLIDENNKTETLNLKSQICVV